MKLYEDIQEIVGQGKKKTEAEKDETLSKTQRLRGIRENQREERELQRELKKEKKEVVETLMVPTENNVKQDDELDLFRAIQKLDWDDDVE